MASLWTSYSFTLASREKRPAGERMVEASRRGQSEEAVLLRGEILVVLNQSTRLDHEGEAATRLHWRHEPVGHHRLGEEPDDLLMV